ncbi:MAG: hypothetical protein ABIR06_11770 [Cyclobacteriaceae bacterium]
MKTTNQFYGNAGFIPGIVLQPFVTVCPQDSCWLSDGHTIPDDISFKK